MTHRFIQIMRLCNRRNNHSNEKDIGRGTRELVVAGNSEFHSDAEGLDGHDRERSYQGADANIDNGIC
jgi:hypothetical protein